MKKLFTLALMALMSAASVCAEDIVFADLGYSNAQDVTSVEGTDVTLTLAKGTNSNNGPKYYTTGTGLRLYNGNTMNIQASSGKVIKKIIFTFSGNSYTFGSATVTAGKYSTDAAVGTWEGSSDDFTLTSAATCRLQKMEISLETASDNRTATSIEFSGNYATKFTYGANGESCALPSATVKAGETPIDAIVTWEVTKGADFVVGDEEPVIEGNAVKPSNHSYGKLTLKASFAGDTQNKPSSKSYDLTVYKGYMKISEILTDFQKENTRFTSTGIPVSYWCMADETTAGTATVTYVNGSNTYINDGTNDLLLYGSNLGLTKGDVISCDKGNDQGFDGIYGTMKQYSGLLEFVISAADMKFTIKSQGATVTPKTIDVADLGAIANMNAYLKIENAEYVSADNKNLTFKVGEASFIVRQNWTNVSIDGLEATAKYTLEGMGAVYKTSTATTYQLYLTSWTKTGEPTAINEVKANTLQNGAVYNVAGQKVNAGYKGLVIKNGKKVVNK